MTAIPNTGADPHPRALRALRATVEAAIPRPPAGVFGYLSTHENKPDYPFTQRPPRVAAVTGGSIDE